MWLLILVLQAGPNQVAQKTYWNSQAECETKLKSFAEKYQRSHIEVVDAFCAQEVEVLQ